MRRESHAHVSAFLPVPTQLPANKRYTLFAFSIPSFSHFFVIIVVAIDETNAKPLKQRVSDSGLDLPSQKKTRRAVCLVPLRIIPLNWHAFTCISPISSAHLHTSLAPGLITITQPFCKLHENFLLLFVHAYAFLWPLRLTHSVSFFLFLTIYQTKTGPTVIIHHHRNLSLECPFGF